MVEVVFFQAISGIRMDQNKGFLPVLYSKVFGRAPLFSTYLIFYFVKEWMKKESFLIVLLCGLSEAKVGK